MNETVLAEKYPGYRIEDRSVAMSALPLWLFVLMLVLMIVPVLLYMAVHSRTQDWDMAWLTFVYALVLVLLHEGVHAIAWKWASGLPWSAFSFGIQWKTVTPYCHSNTPMPVKAYRIGALMPLILTGLLPWVIAVIVQDVDLANASALLISGAGGDLFILWSIRDLPASVLLQDHDTQAGCIVLWPPNS